MADEILFKDIKSAAKKLTPSEALESEEISQSSKAELLAKQLAVQIDGNIQFLKLQRQWANHIKWQIWAVLGFQFIFVFLIGFNVRSFADNLNKLPYSYGLIILQSLANIIALGFVVAKFLFPTNLQPKSN